MYAEQRKDACVDLCSLSSCNVADLESQKGWLIASHCCRRCTLTFYAVMSSVGVRALCGGVN